METFEAFCAWGRLKIFERVKDLGRLFGFAWQVICQHVLVNLPLFFESELLLILYVNSDWADGVEHSCIMKQVQHIQGFFFFFALAGFTKPKTLF